MCDGGGIKKIIPYVYVCVCFGDVRRDHGNMLLYLGVKDNEGFCLIKWFHFTFNFFTLFLFWVQRIEWECVWCKRCYLYLFIFFVYEYISFNDSDNIRNKATTMDNSYNKNKMTLKMENNGSNYMKVISLLDLFNTKVQGQARR
jgi:hypothetical protein